MLRRMCAGPVRWIGSIAATEPAPTANPVPASSEDCRN